MKIKLLVYGALRDYFTSEKELYCDKGLSVSDFVDGLIKRVPKSAELIARSRIALNNSFVLGDMQLKDRDIVLLFPPSSGG